MIHRNNNLFSSLLSEGKLVRGALVSAVLQAFGAGLIFLVEVVLARTLGAPSYGIFATISAWLQVLMLISLMGTNYLLLRHVPSFLAHSDWSLLRGVLRWCFAIGLSNSLLVYCLVVLTVFFLNDLLDAEFQWAFIIGLLALPFYVLSLQRQAVLRGLQSVAYALIPEYIIRPLSLILFLLLLVSWFGGQISSSVALGANVVAAAIAFIFGWLWQRQATPPEATKAISVYHSRSWIGTTFPLFLIALMQLLIVRLDIILLGAITGREAAGYYAAASRVADLVVFFLAAANVVVAPMIASLYAKNDISELQRVLRVLVKNVLIFTLPVVLCLFLFGEHVLKLFGKEYSVGYFPLLILVGGQIMNALLGPVDFILSMTGHHNQSARIFGVAVVLNLTLNLLLIPVFGMAGAAFATALTIGFWKLLMLWYIKRNLGVDCSIMVLFKRHYETES